MPDIFDTKCKYPLHMSGISSKIIYIRTLSELNLPVWMQFQNQGTEKSGSLEFNQRL